ncbi:hypothetical protein [Dokdonella sp.]
MRADTIGIGQDQIVAWSGADGDRRLDRRQGSDHSFVIIRHI